MRVQLWKRPLPSIVLVVASFVVVTALVLSWFVPDGLQVCAIPQGGGQGDCHTDQVLVALVHGGIIWVNGMQGFFLVVLAGLAFWIAVLQRKTMVTQERIMDETKERSLRAYLSFRPDMVEEGTSNSEVQIRFRSKIVNRGQTPAYNVFIASRSAVFLPPFPQQHVIVPEAASGILPPDADFDADDRDALQIQVADYPEFKAGRKRVYYFGFIVYEDAFRKRWKQRFCVFMSFDVVLAGKTLLTINDTWNEEVCIGGQPDCEPHTDF